MTFEVM